MISYPGAFGAPPGLQDYSNMAAMNYAGAQQQQNLSYGFDARQQFAFATEKRGAPTLGHHAPRYASHSYGIKDNIKHTFVARDYGHNALEGQAAKEEQSALRMMRMKQMGSAAAGIALTGLTYATAGLGTGALGVMGSTAVGTSTLASIGIQAADSFLQIEQDNFKNQQFTNYLTGNVIGRDGAMGLSGKDNTEITKMMQSSAANDPLMDMKEMQDLMKGFKVSGGLDSAGNKGAIIKQFKDMKAAVKELAGVFGSGDFDALQKEVAQFRRLGFTVDQSKSMATTFKTTASVAGISYSDVKQGANAWVQKASPNQDRRMSVMLSGENDLYAASLTQLGDNPTFMRDQKQTRATLANLTQQGDVFQKQMTGYTRGQTLALLSMESKEKGTSLQDEYDDFYSKSVEDQNKYIGNSKTIKTKEGKLIVTNEQTSSALVAADDRVGSLKDKGTVLKGMAKRLISAAKRIYKGKTSFSDEELLAVNAQTYEGQNMAAESRGMLVKVASHMQYFGDTSMIDSGINTQANLEKATLRANEVQEAGKNAKLYSRATTAISRRWANMSFRVGYDAIEELQDRKRIKAGGTGGGVTFSGEKTETSLTNATARSAVHLKAEMQGFGKKKYFSKEVVDIANKYKDTGIVSAAAKGKTYEQFTKETEDTSVYFDKNDHISEEDYKKVTNAVDRQGTKFATNSNSKAKDRPRQFQYADELLVNQTMEDRNLDGNHWWSKYSGYDHFAVKDSIRMNSTVKGMDEMEGLFLKSKVSGLGLNSIQSAAAVAIMHSTADKKETKLRAAEFGITDPEQIDQMTKISVKSKKLDKYEKNKIKEKSKRNLIELNQSDGEDSAYSVGLMNDMTEEDLDKIQPRFKEDMLNTSHSNYISKTSGGGKADSKLTHAESKIYKEMKEKLDDKNISKEDQSEFFEHLKPKTFTGNGIFNDIELEGSEKEVKELVSNFQKEYAREKSGSSDINGKIATIAEKYNVSEALVASIYENTQEKDEGIRNKGKNRLKKEISKEYTEDKNRKAMLNVLNSTGDATNTMMDSISSEFKKEDKKTTIDGVVSLTSSTIEHIGIAVNKSSSWESMWGSTAKDVQN